MQLFAKTTQSAPIEAASVDRLPLSLQSLIQRLGQTQNPSPNQIKRHVYQANISAEDLMPWADFSHPVADSYGRKLVFHGGHFEIMVMSWVPGDCSAIHDHGGAQWGAVQCFGAAEHYIYGYRQGSLTTLKLAHYTPGMIHQVDHSLIHQMGNASDMPFLSLHVYGCASPRQMITGDARIFDLFEGSIQYTDGGVFFCLADAQIKRRHLGLWGDAETQLRHHRHMRDRIQRILAGQASSTLEEKLERLNDAISSN